MIAVGFSFFFASIFPLITAKHWNLAVLIPTYSKLTVFVATSILPVAVPTAILLEGFYTTSWARNLVVNALGFSFAVLITCVYIAASQSGQSFTLSYLQDFSIFAANILGLSWLMMGIPFCFFMTIFGVFWAKAWHPPS